MVFFNWATMQMAAKIVYYGPGLCGKTSNLSYIYAKTSPKSRGEMVSLETESDRTLFFDLLPIEVGTIGGFKTRLQLYTVPGQVFYNTTRQLVLKGVDGLVFVADSQRPMREANIESFKSLMENIEGLGLNLDDLPLVLQFNKRDLDNLLTEEELNADLNPEGMFSWHYSSAITGEGVFETLKEITKVTLKKLRKRMAAPQTDAEPPRPMPAPAPPTIEPARANSPAPISASSLARAAEEGAADDFPSAPVPDAPAFAEDEVSDSPESVEPPSPMEVSEPDDLAAEMPVDEIEIDDAVESEEDPMEATPEEDNQGPSPNEITSPSIEDLPIDEPFGRPDLDVPEAAELEPVTEEEALEEIEEVEEIEIADVNEPEEVVEFDTGVDGMPTAVPPPVKRVQVSDENDILSQLDGLRRHATEASFSRSSGGLGKRDLDIDSLLTGSKPHTRDLKRRIEHSLNSNLFERMRSMQVAFRIQDEDGNTIHTLDPVSVDIDDASLLEKLILQLTIDLENIL